MKLNPEKFEWLGNEFIQIHERENLSAENLNFPLGAAEKRESCGTVACHGGWGNVILNTELGYYEHGANAIARHLGFKSGEEMMYFFIVNYVLWGNFFAGRMFCFDGYKAFGFGTPGICTLKDIGNHYIAVARRIREANGEEQSKRTPRQLTHRRASV